MSADHLQFLKNKFMTDFQEAMEEFGELLPLQLHFHKVLEVLREWRISPSTPIRMKDLLYDLKYALAGCIILAEKELNRKRENKKSLVSTLFVKKLLFLHKTRNKLLRINVKLLRGLNDEANPTLGSSWPRYLLAARLPEEFPRFDASKIHGFDDYFEKIKSLLTETPAAGDDGMIKTIGIVGMGGSGKTALAQMLFQSPLVQEKFSPMIWVQLPDKYNPENADFRKRIVGEILGCPPNESYWKWIVYDRVNLLQALHLHLQNKKYLIVLDNVWHASDWYFDLDSKLQTTTTNGMSSFTRLTHGLPKGSGGAIIVTSRLEGVAGRMVGEHNLHQIQPTLDADACWSIFMDIINEKSFLLTPEYCYRTLSNMKDEIVYQCHGLPLAAKVLAEVISIQIGKEEFWSDLNVEKNIVLRLNVHDKKSVRMACEHIIAFPGVFSVASALGKRFKEWNTEGKCIGDGRDNTFRVSGAFNLLEMVKELEKSWHTAHLS